MPTRSVPEAPIVAPALMPPILSGKVWPRNVSVPLPPETPMINPALKM